MQTFIRHCTTAFSQYHITTALKVVVVIALAITCTQVLADGYNTSMPSELKKWLGILQGVGGGVFVIGIVHRSLSINRTSPY